MRSASQFRHRPYALDLNAALRYAKSAISAGAAERNSLFSRLPCAAASSVSRTGLFRREDRIGTPSR